MFILKLYDKSLVKFDIDEDILDGQKISDFHILEPESNYLLPIGVDGSSDSLMKWLKSRVIPKNREFVDFFLWGTIRKYCKRIYNRKTKRKTEKNDRIQI